MDTENRIKEEKMPPHPQITVEENGDHTAYT